MIMAHFCQTAGNAAQGEEPVQTHKHKQTLARTPTPHAHCHTHTHAHKTLEDRQLLIELR